MRSGGPSTKSPELGLNTPTTTAKIKTALAGLPLEIKEGPSTTGFIAKLQGPANGRTVLLRADMDALPMREDTGLPFASRREGAMHACGHDSHVAMLMGAAKALCANRDRLAGSVLFMFQPGEEGHHGARFMLDDGLDRSASRTQLLRCMSGRIFRVVPWPGAPAPCLPRPTESLLRLPAKADMPRSRI